MKVLYAEISVRSRVWPTAMENFFSQRDSQEYAFKNVIAATRGHMSVHAMPD